MRLDNLPDHLEDFIEEQLWKPVPIQVSDKLSEHRQAMPCSLPMFSKSPNQHSLKALPSNRGSATPGLIPAIARSSHPSQPAAVNSRLSPPKNTCRGAVAKSSVRAHRVSCG